MSVAPQEDPSAIDAMVAALTAGAADRPESRVLDQLVGDWRVRSAWEPVVGRGVLQRENRLRTRWILAGRVLESSTSGPDGSEAAKVLYAFDPTVGDYAAFSVTVLSNHFVLERGRYHPEDRSLVFEGMEPRTDGHAPVRFRRTIRVESADAYTVTIGYPDVPEGTYGPMALLVERAG